MRKVSSHFFNSFFQFISRFFDGRNPETCIIQARGQFPVFNVLWLGTIITDPDYKVRVQNPVENQSQN